MTNYNLQLISPNTLQKSTKFKLKLRSPIIKKLEPIQIKRW